MVGRSVVRYTVSRLVRDGHLALLTEPGRRPAVLALGSGADAGADLAAVLSTWR